MLQAVTHVGIALADLASAEAFYSELFKMEVVLRESKTADGWKTLDSSIDWERAATLGVTIDLSILRSGEVVLALERSDVSRLPDHVGLRLEPAAFVTVATRARAQGLEIGIDSPQRFVFTDRLGMTWELQTGDDIPTSREMGRGWIDAEGGAHAG